MLLDSDTPIPEVVNTEAKQVRWAKQLAAEHLGSPSKGRTWQPPFQDISRTVFLKLQDERDVVIQFRSKRVDVSAFAIAKEILGHYVPDIEALRNEELEKAGVWAYYMNRIPGEVWLREQKQKNPQGRMGVNKSLGRIFSKGFMADNSREAVNSVLRPKVDMLLASNLKDIMPFKETLQGLSEKLVEFSQLPLWVTHCDLNEFNVLIDEKHEVAGLVDWDGSVPLPFGIGFGQIHHHTGEFHDGKFYWEEFELAERGFWDALFDGMPKQIRAQLKERINLVQDAVILGTLLFALTKLDGSIGCGGPTLEALPKWITYRLPFLRGEAKAYKETA